MSENISSDYIKYLSIFLKGSMLPLPHILIPIDYAPTIQPMFNVWYFGEMK